MACVFHLYEHLHCRAGSLDIVDAQYGGASFESESISDSSWQKGFVGAYAQQAGEH